MNREIKFRGLRKDGGGWAKGALCGNYIAEDTILVDYVPNPTRYEIGGWLEVILETVGQYAGLKDKNGKEIYEDDVFKSSFWNSVHVVKPEYGGLRVGARLIKRRGGHWPPQCLECFNPEEIEVIGNIRENLELINA